MWTLFIQLPEQFSAGMLTFHRVEYVSEILWKKSFSSPLASWGRVTGGHTKVYQRSRKGWATIPAAEGHPRCVLRMAFHIPTFEIRKM